MSFFSLFAFAMQHIQVGFLALSFFKDVQLTFFMPLEDTAPPPPSETWSSSFTCLALNLPTPYCRTC